MRFEMTRYAIEHQFDRIVFARTATEIKSSIGADAYEMQLFLRHEHRVFHFFLPYLMSLIAKREKWLARHPFK
jgi:hypothetical protein